MVLVEKVGRRIIINTTLLIGGAFCLAAGLTSKEYNDVIIAFSLVGKYCVTMLSVTSQINTAEMFPTAARGQGTFKYFTLKIFGFRFIKLLIYFVKSKSSRFVRYYRQTWWYCIALYCEFGN